MLYVCLPVHNESATVGVLLWRLRTVLQEAGRDYEVVVYDDASTDATAEVLAPYARVMPLTVLGGPGAAPRGRTAATVALLGHVAGHSRYPRRDACILFQGDFTDRPEELPAYLAAFDGGADVVVGRRAPEPDQPPAERRLRRLAPWVLRPLVRVEGVDDLLAGPRLLRVAAVRDMARDRGERPLLAWDGWAGQAELVVAAVSHARRVAVVDTPGRYAVRTRASRLDWATELRSLARYAWQARGTRARLRPPPRAPGSTAAAGSPHPAGGPDDALITAASESTLTAPVRAERPRRGKRGAAPAESVAAGTPASATPPSPAPDSAASDRSRASGERPRAKARGRGAARAATSADAAPVPGRTSAGVSDTTPPLPADASLHDVPTPSTSAAPAVEETSDDGPPSRRRKRRSKPRSAAGEPPGVGTSEPTSTGEPRATTGDVAGTTEPPDALAPGDGDRDAEHATPEDATSNDADGTPGRAKRRRRRRSRGRSAGGSSGVEEDVASPRPTGAVPPDGGEPPRPPAPAPPDHSLSPQ